MVDAPSGHGAVSLGLAGSDQDMRFRVKGEAALYKAAVANGAWWLADESLFVFFVTTAAGSNAGGREGGGREAEGGRERERETLTDRWAAPAITSMRPVVHRTTL